MSHLTVRSPFHDGAVVFCFLLFLISCYNAIVSIISIVSCLLTYGLTLLVVFTGTIIWLFPGDIRASLMGRVRAVLPFCKQNVTKLVSMTNVGSPQVQAHVSIPDKKENIVSVHTTMAENVKDKASVSEAESFIDKNSSPVKTLWSIYYYFFFLKKHSHLSKSAAVDRSFCPSTYAEAEAFVVAVSGEIWQEFLEDFLTHFENRMHIEENATDETKNLINRTGIHELWARRQTSLECTTSERDYTRLRFMQAKLN